MHNVADGPGIVLLVLDVHDPGWSRRGVCGRGGGGQAVRFVFHIDAARLIFRRHDPSSRIELVLHMTSRIRELVSAHESPFALQPPHSSAFSRRTSRAGDVDGHFMSVYLA